MDAQGKHIIGHKNYIPGRSIVTLPESEIGTIIEKYAGTGRGFVSKSGEVVYNRELVEVDKVIGNFVSNGDSLPTKKIIIHHSKNGAHIVPANPNSNY